MTDIFLHREAARFHSHGKVTRMTEVAVLCFPLLELINATKSGKGESHTAVLTHSYSFRCCFDASACWLRDVSAFSIFPESEKCLPDEATCLLCDF